MKNSLAAILFAPIFFMCSSNESIEEFNAEQSQIELCECVNNLLPMMRELVLVSDNSAQSKLVLRKYDTSSIENFNRKDCEKMINEVELKFHDKDTSNRLAGLSVSEVGKLIGEETHCMDIEEYMTLYHDMWLKLTSRPNKMQDIMEE